MSLLTLGTASASQPAATASSQNTRADTLRTLQPEDLFRYHRVGDVRFSPDGDALAYELARPGSDGPTERLPQHFEARSDIWIATGEDSEPRSLTSGASDGTGWFHPRWSPDGEHLAFLSVDGNEVRAWLWERDTEEPRQLTERPVHLTNVGPLLFRWVSERELALAVRPEGAPERGRLLAEQKRPGLFAMRAWETSWSGQEVTADIFDGRPEADEHDYLPRTELALFDVDGSSQIAAAGRWGLTVPSPDGEWAATLSDPSVGSVDPVQPLRQQLTFATRPGMVPLGAEKGEAVSRDANPSEALDDPLARTLRWAPDGSAFALLARSFTEEGKSPRTRLAVLRRGDDQLRFVDDANMQIEGFAWTADGTLLVRARRSEEAGEADQSHWWHPPMDSDGEWENWTAGMEEIPNELVTIPDGVAGIASGAIWRFADGERERILEAEHAELQRLVGPAPPFSPGQAPPQERSPSDPLRILATTSDGPELWTAQVGTGDVQEVRRLTVPEGAGVPEDVAPTGNAAAFSAANETGTWLWLSLAQDMDDVREREESSAATSPDTIVAQDQWLEEVEGAEARPLTYTGPDGDELTAWILLPPEREPEEAHPTVAWIYPGQVHGEQVPFEARLNGINVIFGIGALQVLTSRGYAVLMPSMPLDSGDTNARPDLAGVVISAVNRAAEEGLTDSSRVGLMGHSYGGFGVNHLVSQTDRFEAAVASAASAHLRSFYGTFDARGRYGHMGHPLSLQLVTHGYFESGQGRMGTPPFLAPDRYREASPLTYVDEVNTPLLLIHGDRDFVPVQQSEMFFNELLRLGKPARLVRYAGEGHTISGRANVLHMWEQIFRWFDEHLGDPGTGSD